MANDGNHPIGVDYNSAQLAGRASLRPSSFESGLGGSIAADLLVSGKVECSSCHEPHDMTTGSSRLRMQNEGSRLCLTCHQK